jgi:serine/threonine protein kinase
VQWLKGEVQTARRVSHPNVCRIYDFGSHVMSKSGVQISFLTMEFVEGETLGQRIRLGGPLPLAETQKLARQLLLGLEAAHDAQVLHRDFKSDNVMLRNEANDEICPLIMDFGLARAFDRESNRGSGSSNSTLVGTFSYIAPEQFEGKLHSKASDVYALGVVWFEMLTGELPFESSSSPAVAVLERVRKAAPAPSSRNPEVPRELDAIVLGCLRRSPKDRYRTAGEVLAALDAFESRATLPSNRRSFVAAAFALGLAGIAGIAAYRVLGVPPTSSPRAQVIPTLASASPAAQPAAALPTPISKGQVATSETSGSEPPAPKQARAQQARAHSKTSATSNPSASAAVAAKAVPAVAAFEDSVGPAWENPFPAAGRAGQPGSQ